MKRKNLLLTLLLALLVPWAAQAQQTLPVHDGGETNRYVPFYGYFADDDQTNQMIYPATELTDMAGGTITQMVLYWQEGDSYSNYNGVGTWTVSLGETTATTLDGLDNTTTLSDVFTGVLDEDGGLFNTTDHTLTITFTVPYVYNGGNLLIQFYHEETGEYEDYVFKGETVEGASYCYDVKRNFLPKTTFTYTPDANYCGKPANVHIVENTLGPREVAIEWDAESGELFQISMQATSSFDPNDINWSDATTSHYEEWDLLTPETDYTFCVRKKCGTDSYSQPVFLEFRTPVACPAPTLALTANSETARGATLNWTGFSESYILQMGSIASTQTQTILSEGFESGSMPTGWTTTGSYWQITSGTGNSSYSGSANGSYNAGCYIGSYSGSDILVTPAMDLSTALSATLDFNFWNTNWDGDINVLNVYYRVDGGDWNLLYTNDDEVSSWEAVPTITLQGLAANYQIGFECVSSWSYGMGIDDVQVNAEVVEFEWITFDNNATSPYTFNTLLPETTYYTRVIGNCGSDGQSQPSNMVSFTTLATCPVPQNLVVTTDGATATATWTDTEGTCNISINGTVTNNVTSPYTFNVNLSTTYEVMVQANCTGETSGWSEAYSFTTPPCLGGHVIEYTLNDSYGDGWIGGYNNPTISAILINEACDIYETLTLPASTSTGSGSLTLCGEYYQIVWQAGQYPDECSFTLIVDGTPVYTNQSGSSLTDGQVLLTLGTAPDMLPKPTDIANGTPDKREVELSWTENGTATAWEICVNGDETNLIGTHENPYTLDGLTPDTDYAVKVRATDGTNVSCWSDEINFTTAEACAKPTNLAENNITYTTVDLSWEGTSDSFVAQYGTWTQVGTDHIATATLVPYTFDLSAFSGKGTIAIRHYNVTDMFRLNVDDIVVKDANNTVVYSQNFESGSIPSTMSNIDLDGDGNVWDIVGSTFNVNGSYGASSSSWLSGTALNPDNWLVISDVMLGGSITFYAAGQDASAASENFGVYVIADSQFTEAYSGTETSCQVTGLTEGTPYVWRVRGICGEDPSNWVSSMFKTKDDLLVFTTDGAWSEISNWTDADGNAVAALPTVENKVRMDADATVASGEVATAKNITLNGGSIEIEDGGQLKQGGSVSVTMHKEIIGYGEGNEEAKDHYYFIATPHSCSYLEQNDVFPYVLNVTDGNYDLYAFDPTADLEWINYESSSDHSEFHTGNNYGLFNKKGYLYANETAKDLIFVGTVSSSLNNTLTDSYTYNADASYELNGWKLVGNPFTCDAYISYVDGEDVLDADFYVMNAYGNGYVLIDSDEPLPPTEGAFINYSATGTVQFSTEIPTSGNTGMLNMTLSQGRGSIDQARVRFGRGFNMQHLSFRNNSSSIYMPVDGNDFAVVYSEKNADEMPVSFKAEKNGTYTLGFNIENVEFSYLHLIDNMTGNDVDLLANPSYSFEAKTTDYASRFKLVFSTGSNGDNFAFMNNSNIIVNNEGEATLQVIDINGRIIRSESINGTASIKMNASAGVYMLRLINGNDVKVQKIVVR